MGVDARPRPGQGPLRVLVVDADDRVRESLAGLLGIGGRLVVVGSAGQPGPGPRPARAESPDVVIVDPRLPEVDGGLEFISRLRAMAPNVRIVVMSSIATARDPPWPRRRRVHPQDLPPQRAHRGDRGRRAARREPWPAPRFDRLD